MSLAVEDPFVKKRRMIDLALAALRKRVSPQTGLVHFHREDPLNTRQDSIGIHENFLYVLALFRSKSIENISEGKLLLSKLLAFEVDGNFPVYLHEFPTIREEQFSTQILPVLFYLLKDFSLALGEDLTKKLSLLSDRIVLFLRKQEENLSKASRARLSAFLGTFDPDSWTPKSPSDWAEYCLCCQMSGRDISKALPYWNRDLAVFTGPGPRFQEGKEPIVTLFDLFMGEYFQHFSKRALLDHPVHVKAALIHPFEEFVQKDEKDPWISLIEEEERQALTLYFGGPSLLHSCVLEAKKGILKVSEVAEGFECLYLFEETLPLEDETTEFAFYLNNSTESTWRVEGEKATVFYPGEWVSISIDSLEISFRMYGEEGKWMGHILRGDRSFQLGRSLPYGGYDWKVGFRTIERKSLAKAKIEIKLRSF